MTLCTNPSASRSAESLLKYSSSRSRGTLQLRSRPLNRESGLTLVELIICVAIVALLASAAIPIARFQVKRTKERELRRDLWEMRDAIDHYKDAADKGAFMTKLDSQGYPPDLEELVKGVDVQSKKVKFLRKIPIDPMTGKAKWEAPSDIPRFSGVLSTAGGVVFSGQLTGEFEAFDANDGKKLWQFQTGSGIEGQPVTWEQDGVQYVAVTSGYGGVYSLFSGDERLAQIPTGGSLWLFAVKKPQ